ncbi:phytoene desaturase family protein [Fluviicola taffensis]|uniref:All-trans-retinol 13,14-reductase n=1 Tax=Fluviicola taffensis (strain DSM 16823 / NCIMB 13979 / RW262) TaxID=755732 RepID=F2IDP7_FLUTR|nr:NAD(P)/FAD-dependent oxidoreductase [Fluviicola taffensis]AEA43420.1 All-trans-retinol 13,14-reductase [Fluviicola taffensis DSM 16823]
MEEPQKIVVIGSGMGGLVTALILAKHGYQVKVLEKNHQIGGSLQVFSRDKRIFDTGVHYVGGLDKGENLYQIFKYLNIMDDLDLHRMDENAFDVIRLSNGQVIKHGMGYANFEKKLKESFPNNHQDIENICQEIRLYCSYFPLYNLELDSEINYIENSVVLEVGAWERLAALTDNEDLIKAVLGSGPLYAGIKGITPFYVMALILNSFIKGSYRFVNGASQIAKILMKRISEHGGEVLRRKEVVSVTYDEAGCIRSVICADKSEFVCDSVISNLHPTETIAIVGESNFKNPFIKRLKSLPNTVSSFMMYISFEENKFPYFNSNFYDYFTDNIWDEEFHFSEEWPQMTFTSAQVSKNTDEFAESISIMCYLDIKELKAWEDSVRTVVVEGERHVDYEEFKDVCVERILKRIETRFPGIRAHIKNVYSSTPITYRDYIATPGGSMYGFQKDFNQIHKSQINTRTHVPNLYLTGQNIIFHGILGATIGALVTSFNFVDNKEVIEKIKNYD